jgi:hypothetical protein
MMPHIKSPCHDCPWRTDAPLEFSVDALEKTRIAMRPRSDIEVVCHNSNGKAVCAGWFLHYGCHEEAPTVHDRGLSLFEDFAELMAANRSVAK